MKEMIEERRSSMGNEASYDLLNALVEGCEKETESESLTDNELIGENVLLFLYYFSS